VFFLGKPFKLHLMFASKARAYSSGAPFKDFTLRVYYYTTLNIRVGWKSLPGTNTIAYFDDS